MKALVIKLTAPLQSYGDQASFNYRTSFHYPSKSAVLGMIGAALGYRRVDRANQKLNDLKFAVRIDQPGTMMTDFQISQYAKGKKLSHRNYLQDAVFLVAVGSDDDTLIEQIFYALKHPKFQLYLGRRSNPPAGVLKTWLFDEQTPITALKQMSWEAPKYYQQQKLVEIRKRGKDQVRLTLVADAELLPEKPNFLAKDLIGSFDEKHRSYKYRAVAETMIEINAEKIEDSLSDTDHDVMANI